MARRGIWIGVSSPLCLGENWGKKREKKQRGEKRENIPL